MGLHILHDSILISLSISLGGKVELQWKIAPRELSGEEDTGEEVRLSDLCCETLRLGGCRKGTEDGPATDAPPDTDDTRRKVQKVHIISPYYRTKPHARGRIMLLLSTWTLCPLAFRVQCLHMKFC